MTGADPLVRVPEGFAGQWPGVRADATEVVLNVIRAGELLASLVDGFVRDRGLPSATALIVLEVLRGEGGPLPPSVVADRCFVSRPVLTGVMDTLERRGLLRRSPHPNDRRRALAEITVQGVKTMEALLPELHRAEATWTSGLTAKNKTLLLDLLGQLCQGLPNRR